MHTVLLSPESNLLWPLSAVCPWLSLCKLILEHLYLVLPDTLTHTHCFNEMEYCDLGSPAVRSHVTLHTGWLTHVTVVTVVNLRQEEGMTAAGGLGSEWRAGIGSFCLHPPIAATVNARRNR